MYRVREVAEFLESFAPPALAEAWDNVGLLLGDAEASVGSALTCLTLTPDVAEEAVRGGFGLIVTHHPIFFRPVKRLTMETAEGATALKLARAGVAVYSPHTAFDGAAGGVNERIAGRLGLAETAPLRPAAGLGLGFGAGRIGRLAEPCGFPEAVRRIKAAFGLDSVEAVPTERRIANVGIGCGSAAEFLGDAARAGCDLFVTGEARFHSAIEARTLGVGLVLLGHYASERFAVEELAGVIAARFPGLDVRPSRVETDPIMRL